MKTETSQGIGALLALSDYDAEPGSGIDAARTASSAPVALWLEVPCSEHECGSCSGLCNPDQYFRTDKCEAAQRRAAAMLKVILAAKLTAKDAISNLPELIDAVVELQVIEDGSDQTSSATSTRIPSF